MLHDSSRRAFLQSSAALLAATAASPLLSAEKKVPLVDTHVHCFAGTKDERFPYHKHAPYKPEDVASPENLLAAMDAAGVNYAVIVHPEPYQDDHRYLEHVLGVGGKRLKATALVFAEQPQSVAQLPTLAKRMAIAAVRVHAYAPERLPPFGKPELKQLWKLAGDLGLAVQLHLEPRYAPQFTPLIKEFSTVPVIIDHLGRPLQGTPAEHEVVVKWADHKNTIMKISSLPATRMYPHRDLQPVIHQLFDAYGSDRLIYGGGFDGSPKPDSYQGAFARARGYFADRTAEDTNKIFGLNALKLFRFDA
ncbi:amidohydrolase [Anatilimnocola sp. NA78]|uniref:amidohydrolase family protein n=1 Tax=Anatilimnocola sp. NA78 TaxID=3415683 RepID=UPI003CE5B24D